MGWGGVGGIKLNEKLANLVCWELTHKFEGCYIDCSFLLRSCWYNLALFGAEIRLLRCVNCKTEMMQECVTDLYRARKWLIHFKVAKHQTLLRTQQFLGVKQRYRE